MSARNWIWMVLLLGACAKPQPWEKEGVEEDQRQADQHACEMAATMEVQRQRNKSVSTMGPAVVGPTRRSTSPYGGPFSDPRGTQLVDEDRLIDECMRGKGYVRAKPK